jgi:hypothetical protein
MVWGSSGTGSPRHRPDTLWKLVDARCRQLTDAVAATRTPFIVALTWSFIWAWALYSNEFSYLNTYETRYFFYKLVASHAEESVEKTSQFRELCERRILPRKVPNPFGDKEHEITALGHQALCKEIIAARHTDAVRRVYDSRFVSFPGGFTKLYITDLAIMGNVGLLLILLWCFYSSRRENHAIKTFIYLKDESEAGYPVTFNKTVDLIPRDEFLSPEHYAFAYNAVSQRFVFILTEVVPQFQTGR